MITRQRAEEAAGAHGAARPCGPAGPGGERLLGGQSDCAELCDEDS